MIGQCEVCGQWHTGEHPITVMTPTTSDREALIAAAEEIEYGHAWISREAASTIIYKHADALTREQREGVECRNPCTPCDFFNARACEKCVAERYSPPFGQPQQEAQGAQGAVAWVFGCDAPRSGGRPYIAPSNFPIKFYPEDQLGCAMKRVDMLRSLVASINASTQPAPVDVRVPMSRIIELLAQLVNAPQTDDEFDADVIRRDVVMEKVTQLRMAWDELSKAQRALLDGQQAGVDDAMVERFCEVAFQPWGKSAFNDDLVRNLVRPALQAALGGGVRS